MIKKFLYKELQHAKKKYMVIGGLQFLSACTIVGFTAAFASVFKLLFLDRMEPDKAAPYAGVLLCLAFLRFLLDSLQQKTAIGIALQVQEKLRNRLTEKLLSLTPKEQAQRQTGDFLALMMHSVDETDSFFRHFVPQIETALILPLVFFAAALTTDPWTALIFFLTAPILPFLLFLIGKMSATASARQWQTLTLLSRNFFELLQGLTTLKIFNRSRQQLEEINQLSENFRNSTLAVLRIAFLSAFALELISTLSIAIIAVSTGLRLLHGSLGFQEAFFLLLLAPEFYRPLRQCGSSFHQALTAMTAADSIYAFLSPEKKGPPSAAYVKKTQLPFSIRFENVSFSYNQQQEPALKNLSFTIRGGSTTALVGNSGAGKSTIFQLLLKFLQTDQGSIFINENRLDKISAAYWRSRISYVPQTPHIFQRTAAENIDPANRHSQKEIEQAAHDVCLHDFICSLPEGYQTRLSPQSLSGGQIQRFGLARAFLEDRPLLLLDEPEAHLDPETARQIARSLAALPKEKTIILAAHALSSIRQADQILVFADGALCESGTHISLLEKKGNYYDLAAAQGELL